jgi:hypothetical protein
MASTIATEVAASAAAQTALPLAESPSMPDVTNPRRTSLAPARTVPPSERHPQRQRQLRPTRSALPSRTRRTSRTSAARAITLSAALSESLVVLCLCWLGVLERAARAPLAASEVVSVKDCAAGEYLLVERGVCAACPAGTFGAVSGLQSSACSGLCDPGYYCPEGSTSARQEACPAGTYGSAHGLRDASCSGPALAGYYTVSGAVRPDQFACSTQENLFYCPLGSSVPLRLQVGYYAVGGDDNNTRAAQEVCPPGHYCPESLGIKLTCPPGVYGGSYGLTDAACGGECSRGQYCPEASTEPSLCPAGTYNNETGKAALSDCVVCPLGHYCVQESHLPVECPPGQYGDQEGLESSSCSTRCTALASMDDQTDFANIICVASQCEAGYYCPSGSVSARQVECGDVRLYCPAGSSIPVPVDEGYYTVPAPGAEGANPANTTQVAQVLCEPGNYCVEGSKYTCPAGYYGGSFGLSTAECSGQCSPGFTCAAGSVDGRATQCGNSTVYCPTGSFEVVPVSVGYYAVGYECPTSVVDFLRLSGDFPAADTGDDALVDEAGVRAKVLTFALNYKLVPSESDFDALTEDEVLALLVEYRDVWGVSCVPDYHADRLGGSGACVRGCGRQGARRPAVLGVGWGVCSRVAAAAVVVAAVAAAGDGSGRCG